jgi:hypothetical protein
MSLLRKKMEYKNRIDFFYRAGVADSVTVHTRINTIIKKKFFF